MGPVSSQGSSDGRGRQEVQRAIEPEKDITPAQCGHQQCLQALPGVPWGTKSPSVKACLECVLSSVPHATPLPSATWGRLLREAEEICMEPGTLSHPAPHAPQHRGWQEALLQPVSIWGPWRMGGHGKSRLSWKGAMTPHTSQGTLRKSKRTLGSEKTSP